MITNQDFIKERITTNNGDDVGGISFTVDAGAPNTLYYICQFHSPMTGAINIIG